MRLRDVPRRAPTVRQWLAMLLAAFIVPAALAVATLSVHAYERERAGVERAYLDVARALMQAIDRELASAQAAMKALATSPNLDRPDLRAFYGQATEVLHSRPGNVLLLLDCTRRNRVVFDDLLSHLRSNRCAHELLGKLTERTILGCLGTSNLLITPFFRCSIEQ